VVIGVLAIVVAVSLDLLQYENFLLLIGGVFVPVFGILLSDYYAVRRGRYDVPDLYERSGAYWHDWGVNLVGITAWAIGFVIYAVAAQPPWLLEHADFISWAPLWMTHIGGTIPAFVFSFVAYWAVFQLQSAMRGESRDAALASSART
jgi:NCS1 family nucleobase:cation symporter-1